VPHHHPQRVPGTESLPQRILGFEQVMIGDLDEREVGHVLCYSGG
jgi:hypothetical protein